MNAAAILCFPKLTTAAKTGVLALCVQHAPNATPPVVSPPSLGACAEAVNTFKRHLSAENATPPVTNTTSTGTGALNTFNCHPSTETHTLVEQHLTYLRTISTGDEAVISRETASIAAKAWLDVSDATGNAMPVPAAGTGPDGQLMYVWDKGRHHLELEIAANGTAEFFYRDRESSELWGDDYRPGESFDTELLTKLKLFN